MMKKPKSLLMLGLSFMLLFMIGCREDFIFTKKVDKKKVVVGEVLTVTLSLKNNSKKVIVKSFDIKKELNLKYFAVLGKNEEKGQTPDKNQKKTFTYKLIPVSVGKKKLGKCKVTKVKLTTGEEYTLEDSPKFLNSSLTIEVLPFKPDVSLHVEKDKQNILVGENLYFDIKVQNTTPVGIEALEIACSNVEELKPFIKIEKLKFAGISAGNSRLFPISFKTLRPGRVPLGRIVIKKIKTSGTWIVLDGTCVSNPGPTITIEPPKISVSQVFQKQKLKLGEKFDLKLVASNPSPINVKDVRISFEPDSEKLRLIGPKPKRKYLSLPAGAKTPLFYEFQAVESGTIPPIRAVVKEIQIGESRFSSKKGFATSNATPKLEVMPVRLPGRKFPQTQLTEELENYFNWFLLKTLGIAFLLNALFFIFNLLINTALVENLFGKMLLTFFAAAFLSQILLFFLTGCFWLFRSITPPFLDLLALLTGSICLSFAFVLLPVKNLALGSLISGAVLAVLSYMIFTGFKTYELQGFSNYPISASLAFFFLLGWGFNLWIFRKI